MLANDLDDGGSTCYNSNMEFDFLSLEEANATKVAIVTLKKLPWAAPLINEFKKNGGCSNANKGHLFNLRFALALHHSGVSPKVEIPGENKSKIDFGFERGGYNFCIELMSLRESSGVKSTKVQIEDGVYQQELISSAPDFRQTEEGEITNAIQRICQKCEKNGMAYKFSKPELHQINVLVVDVRIFMLGGGDCNDYVEIALGGKYVNSAPCRHHTSQGLIKGAFDQENTCKGSNFLRERVHFIVFCKETSLDGGLRREFLVPTANPSLFKDAHEAKAAWAAWPLKAQG